MRRLCLILVFALMPTLAEAASAPSPTFAALTLGTLTLAGVAAATDAQAGTATNLVMTPATTRTSTTTQLTTLPTTMPTTVGALWNNGGIISQVQP